MKKYILLIEMLNGIPLHMPAFHSLHINVFLIPISSRKKAKEIKLVIEKKRKKKDIKQY
jgi:hypothetical protein